MSGYIHTYTMFLSHVVDLEKYLDLSCKYYSTSTSVPRQGILGIYYFYYMYLFIIFITFY